MCIFLVYKFYKFHRLAAMLLAVVLQWKTAARSQESLLVISVVHTFVSLQQKEGQIAPPNFSEETPWSDSLFELVVLKRLH